MDELLDVERLNNDSDFFEREFNNLKNFYIFDNEKEVYDFIKINPGIILLLNEFESPLKHYFPKGYFELKFGPDLSGTWFDLLELNIWIDEETFNNGSNEYVRLINKEFRPLRKKLDLLGEVLISKRVLRWSILFSTLTASILIFHLIFSLRIYLPDFFQIHFSISLMLTSGRVNYLNEN